jgi:hypothetical protein
MTEPAPEQPPSPAEPSNATAEPPHPPFAPVFTLVNNTSTRTTHHPHVRYIFSDDDPDVLTQALAEQHDATPDGSASEPASSKRAILLDLEPDAEGGYNVAWSTSLSPSWAVLDAQLSQISPPSSDGGGGTGDEGGESGKRPKRLMLRIDGLESGSTASEGELRLSSEVTRQGSSTESGHSSGHKQSAKGDGDDYASLVDEFDKRMATLRRVVNASEERRHIARPEVADDTRVSPEAAQEPPITT